VRLPGLFAASSPFVFSHALHELLLSQAAERPEPPPVWSRM